MVSVRAFSSSGTSCEDLDIGRNALGLDRAAGRREIARRGQAQRAVAGAQRDDGLHRALAERARADERGALVILQRAGDDFRGRRRAAIDQDDDRLALGQIARVGVEALRLVGVTMSLAITPAFAAGVRCTASVCERTDFRRARSRDSTKFVSLFSPVAVRALMKDPAAIRKGSNEFLGFGARRQQSHSLRDAIFP